MITSWIIEKKRDGKVLSREEIEFLVQGFTSGEIPDSQMSAFAMAVYFRGMDLEETTCLTEAMLNSGEIIDTSAIPGIKVDKHSTGGIGDKFSLILAPLVASCGIIVPMISGRGLGITGGTLDKLESIPGYRTEKTPDEFISILERTGCSIIAQTENLVPADRKLYALRDFTATVPSISLITSSILCKKLAEGIDGLVLDVKFGKGTFMKTREKATELANMLVTVGRNLGKDVTALVTDMNRPLGTAAGNFLEVKEAVRFLKGESHPDIKELTFALGAEMLGFRSPSDKEAAVREFEANITSGKALGYFRQMVELHGGDSSALDDSERMCAAQVVEVNASEEGYIADIDAEQIGRAVVLTGAGRKKPGEAVKALAGVDRIVRRGESVRKGDVLLRIHADNRADIDAALTHAESAFTFSDSKPEHTPIVADRITA